MSIFRKESAGIMIEIELHLKIILEELIFNNIESSNPWIEHSISLGLLEFLSAIYIYIFFPQPYFIDFVRWDLTHNLWKNFPKVVNIVF